MQSDIKNWPGIFENSLESIPIYENNECASSTLLKIEPPTSNELPDTSNELPNTLNESIAHDDNKGHLRKNRSDIFF